jgi:hypothetical protein
MVGEGCCDPRYDEEGWFDLLQSDLLVAGKVQSTSILSATILYGGAMGSTTYLVHLGQVRLLKICCYGSCLKWKMSAMLAK